MVEEIERKKVIKYITSLNQYSSEIVQEAEKYLETPFMVLRKMSLDVPNAVVLRRGKVSGIDMYYTNDFKYFISKYETWDKDVKIIKD